MQDLSFEKLKYEFDEIWDEDWLSIDDYKRVQKIATLIPKGTQSILDVGCGNVLFVNYLKKPAQKTHLRERYQEELDVVLAK